MASWHMPQSVPAPEQRSPIAERVRAPDRTAASISRSLTHLQMQRIIVALPALVEIETDSQHQQDNTAAGAVQAAVTWP
jgi:hypothetical protein